MVAYLTSALPASDDVLALAAPVTPPEVFRFGGTCTETACQNYQDGRCSVATRLVAAAEPVVHQLPRCAIRSTCRWWAENGKAACVRCPAVVTLDYTPHTGGSGNCRSVWN